MKKFIILVDVSLNANDGYFSSIDNVFLDIIEEVSEEAALTKAKEKYTDEDIKSLSSFACGYDFYIHLKEIC